MSLKIYIIAPEQNQNNWEFNELVSVPSMVTLKISPTPNAFAQSSQRRKGLPLVGHLATQHALRVKARARS